MAERPKILEIGNSGYYAVLPTAQEFVEIMPAQGSDARRLRFRLGLSAGAAITLDIPISEDCIARMKKVLSEH